MTHIFAAKHKHTLQKLLMLVCLSSFLVPIWSARAQITDSIFHFDRKRESIFATDTHLVQGIGWVRSHIADNWFIQLQGGGQLYYGAEDRLGAFADRLTYNGELHIGRWVFPMVGYRFGFGYGYAHGFISKNTFHNYSIQGGIGQHEMGLTGYYYNYDKNSNLYMQKWKYAYGSVDALVNLSYALKYRPEMHWLTWLYGGVSIYYSLSDGYKGSDGVVDRKIDPNRAAEAHIGVIEKYQINEHWNLYADARLGFMHRTFDREYVNGYEKALDIADAMLHLQIGVDYNFHWRNEAKRTQWYAKRYGTSIADGQHAPRHLYTTHQASFKVEWFRDSIFVRDTVALHDTIRSLWRECEEATLDDILGKHLLPYEMVLFDLDKWFIRPDEESRIARMAAVIKSFPDYQFLVIGSADSKTGTISRNDFLSHQRADTVYYRLIHKYGIDSTQLKRIYLGGILDYEPYQVNRATVIIMNHPKVVEEFSRLSMNGRRSGTFVLSSMDTIVNLEHRNGYLTEEERNHLDQAINRIEQSLQQSDINEASLGDILDETMLPYEMVFFELDRWDILNDETHKIARMAALIKAFPKHKFLIIGSADSKTGTVKRNKFLSHNRADVVYNRLVRNYGVNPSQLKCIYLGGIMDYRPYQLNRAAVIIMDHPKIKREFNRLKAQGQAGGSSVRF